MAPLPTFLGGGAQKFIIVPMEKSWCCSNDQLLCFCCCIHPCIFDLAADHELHDYGDELGTLWQSKDKTTKGLGLVKGFVRSCKVVLDYFVPACTENLGNWFYGIVPHCLHLGTKILKCLFLLFSKQTEVPTTLTLNIYNLDCPHWDDEAIYKHCRARPCKWPQPYEPDLGLSMSHLFGICHMTSKVT